jgi:myo-inositol-1(or 4)-monophosphatase
VLLTSAVVRHLASATLLELEHTAVYLARMAGDCIRSLAQNDDLTVHFKSSAPGAAHDANPVSNVDREVEARLRLALHERLPRDAVIAEESGIDGDDHAPFVWVIDPLDGTSNFLNGLPLYACSVGVLHKHVPVAGAIWSAATHACHPGTYHARLDAALSFDGVELTRRPQPKWRGLASEPGDVSRYAAFFETRVLASAAVECALTAAGVLRLAYLSNPAIWDVAAGIVLAKAAGCSVVTRRDGAWLPFTGFSASHARKRLNVLRYWRQPVLIGEPKAIEREAAVATALD